MEILADGACNNGTAMCELLGHVGACAYRASAGDGKFDLVGIWSQPGCVGAPDLVDLTDRPPDVLSTCLSNPSTPEVYKLELTGPGPTVTLIMYPHSYL